MRLLKLLIGLVVLGFLALVGFAYLGDMSPRQQEMRQPVALDTGAASSTAAPTASDQAEDEAEAPPEGEAAEADPNDLD
ncbi:hypothetical protein [Paracoccus albus]|uniref:hypothetical protein n=1 Tax=Paracoccus albus TaxID=3017784 RepID=UPI0022F08256|nr:hypothetical protein [Paracoccus albus]WBU59095.1 hypothetical protein PAF20_09800 [Paracoccus albus]